MYKRLCMTFLAVVCALQMMADYNVRNYGAKGDGVTLDSPAINAAIEDAVKQGGGKIQFGIYACSPEQSSFKAVFTDIKLTECAWKAHDGQQPD